MTIVQTGERCESRGDRAVVRVTCHHAVGNAKRERCVRRDRGAVNRKSSLCELCRECLFARYERVHLLSVREIRRPNHIDDGCRRICAAEKSFIQEILESQRRSEEHTSELQSRGHLVCRLLLE